MLLNGQVVKSIENDFSTITKNIYCKKKNK